MNSNRALGLVTCLLIGSLATPSLAVEDFTISNFGDGSQIWFQAEDFDERIPDTDDVLAVTSPPDGEEAFGEEGFNVINRIGTGGRISYTFDIDQLGLPGTWYFWSRIINPTNRSDWLVVEGDPDDAGFPTEEPFEFAGNVPHHRIFEGNVASFAWFGGEEGHTKELRAGENTMHIFNRESGNGSVFWDAFMWTTDPNYVPTDDDFLASEPFVAIDLPGDFNGDGVITEADYQVILDNFNLPVDRGLDGDATFDSLVDYRDLVAFRSLFEEANGTAAAQIPEPSSGIMVCIAVAFLGTLRRRSRRVARASVSLAVLVAAGFASQISTTESLAQEIVIEQLPGTDYLAFEAEDYFSLNNADDETGWNVVGIETPFQSPAPVEPASLILDPATTNAVRSSAIFDFPNGNDQDFVSYRLKFVEDGDYTLYYRYSLFNLRDGAGYGNEDSVYVSSEFGFDGELIDTDADPRGSRDASPSFYQIFSGEENNEGNFGWWNASADGSDPTASNPDAVYIPELNEELDFGIAAREAGVAIDRIIFHQTPDLHLTPEVLDEIVSFDPFTFGEDPNDFNMDGNTDLTDVDIMRENFGLSFDLEDSLAKGDGTRDGFVDLRDFLAVRKIINPPAVAGAGESNSVPEPSGLHLALLSAIAGLATWRRLR